MKRGFPSLVKKGLGLSIGTSWVHRTWDTRDTLNDIGFPLTEMLLGGAVCNVCNPRVEGLLGGASSALMTSTRQQKGNAISAC